MVRNEWRYAADGGLWVLSELRAPRSRRGQLTIVLFSPNASCTGLRFESTLVVRVAADGGDGFSARSRSSSRARACRGGRHRRARGSAALEGRAAEPAAR